MNNINNQKGAAHLFVLIILVVGMIVGLYLVKNPQIFKSRATESTQATPAPLFEDDFSTNTDWELLGSEDGQWDSEHQNYMGYRSYNSIGQWLPNEGLLSLMITSRYGIRFTQKRVNLTGGFTAIYNFSLKASQDDLHIGFHFGGPGDTNVYRFYLFPDGGMYMKYGLGNESAVWGTEISPVGSGVKLINDKNYKLRLDRHLNKLKVWFSEDDGINWKLIAEPPLIPSAAMGADGAIYMGFVAARIPETLYTNVPVGQNLPEIRFDNFKVWKLGQVPEPVVTTTATPIPTPTPTGPYLSSLSMTPANGTTISSTDTIAVTATVNNGDRFDIWIDWNCFATTSLSAQTYRFTLAQIADRNGKPECKASGSHTVHVAPIGTGGAAGRSDGATYTVRP